jgi:GT2 family glycosyltransferase
MEKLSNRRESQEECQQPKVIVIVLSWNGKHNTIECINSLTRLNYSNYEIIVVDNASMDGSQKLLKKTYPGITLIENKQNLGFGEGLNVGIRLGFLRHPDYFLCLNNDVVVDKNILIELVKVGDLSRKIGGLCPLEFDYNNPNRIVCAGGIIRFVKGKLYGFGEFDKGQFKLATTTGLLSGPAMMLNAHALSNLGLFDKSYFYGPEDQDMALRLIRNGYIIAFVPFAKLWHKRRGATNGKITPLNEYFRIRNYLLFIKKNANNFELFFAILYFGFYYFPFALVKNICSGKSQNIRAVMNGVIWHLNRNMVPSDPQMVDFLSAGHRIEIRD